MWSARAWAREVAALSEIAVAAPSQQAFRASALERLQRAIGFDSAVFSSPPGGSLTTLNKPAAVRGVYAARRHRYTPDLTAVSRAVAAAGGVAVDEDLLPAADRDRLEFYAEIVRPQGISSILVGLLTRGSWSSRVFLARH